MASRTPEIFGVPWWLPVGGVLALIMFPALLGRIAGGASRAAIGVVRDAATGAVIGVGEAVGIPATDAAKCADDVERGDWWNASFYCPAGTFLKEAGGAVIDTVTGSVVGVLESPAFAITPLGAATQIIRIVPFKPDAGPLPGIAPPPSPDTGVPGQISDWPAA